MQLGLPEVTLGLLPGGGGVVRLTRLLGLAAALPYLTEGTRVTPDKALAAGMIHATVDSIDELVPNAKAWILAQEDVQAAATQPWDTKGYKVPGGGISSPGVAQLVMVAPAMLFSKTRGLLPAPAQILDCAV